MKERAKLLRKRIADVKTRLWARLQGPFRRAQPVGEVWVRGRGSRNASAASERAGSTSRRPAFASALQARADLYALIRGFMAERGVLEVETPMLSVAGNTEPHIDSFHTEFSGPATAGSGRRYLRTSPEYPLKRLLAAGLEDCYELGRVFRNGEAGRRHNPEFTMLEWYRRGIDHRALAREAAELVQAALLAFGHGRAEIATLDYRDWFLAGAGIDPLLASESELRAPLERFSIDPEGLARSDWLDLLVSHVLEPSLPPGRITIVLDYPASQAALARIRLDDPPVAERFELYLGRQELANGYHELNNGAEQRARFEQDNARRRELAKPMLPLDEHLLAVLDQLPECAGVALGVDRLLMCLTGHGSIAEVLAFSFDRA